MAAILGLAGLQRYDKHEATMQDLHIDDFMILYVIYSTVHDVIYLYSFLHFLPFFISLVLPHIYSTIPSIGISSSKTLDSDRMRCFNRAGPSIGVLHKFLTLLMS